MERFLVGTSPEELAFLKRVQIRYKDSFCIKEISAMSQIEKELEEIEGERNLIQGDELDGENE